MRQIGTGIVIVFVLISLGIVGLGYLQRNQPDPTATPLELTLTVNPMAQAWMNDAVMSFNTSDNRLIDGYAVTIVLNTVPIDDMAVWKNSAWTDQNHPDLWLASTSLAVDYAGYPVRIITPSLAQSPMIWVASADVAQAITQDGISPFDWQTVQAAAQAGTWANFGATGINGNVNIAFALPEGTMNGLMVLYSALANFNQTTTLGNSAMTPAYQTWFTPIIQSVPNLNTIGDNVATFMVSQRGSSVNIGILPEVQLLNQLEALTTRRAIQVAYPAYSVLFDFPLAEWQVTNLPEQEANRRQQAIQAFSEWLLLPAQQAQLPRYGLRPLSENPTESDDLFRLGADVGVEYTPIFAGQLESASVSFANILLAWFAQERQR
ncbi:MAG: substrate-binding domain-containing protein [bacterium]|nr:substrate-binding domain-containing protein [bacterium]